MENKILGLFTKVNKLRFKDIEKGIKERSNKIAYHLKLLTKKGILKKDNSFYSLSDEAEYLIPYISDKKSSLPVILIQIGDKNKIFLYKRKKRPYLNLYGLPGGRLIIGESINEAAKRIMGTKFNINIVPKEIKSISLEHVKKNKKIIHSFILILVTAKAKEAIELLNINQIKNQIIHSDYKLIAESPRKYNLKTISSKT